MEDKKKIVEQTTRDLLDKLGFSKATIEVSDEEQDVILVQIETPENESGILIGFHGETISALQLIISQIVHKQMDDFQRISLNIGDYRQKREESLKTMALNVAQKVKQTKTPTSLPQLSGNDRRIVHITLADDPEVETTSQGEGRERRLVVSLKNSE